MPEPIRLQDLFDTGRLQELLDSFLHAGGFPTGILTPDGEVVTASGWQEICTRFHRRHPGSAQLCAESDRYMAEHLPTVAAPVTYRCRHGLIEVATPIVVDGTHVANAFIGQFLDEPPDVERFRRQARQFGFDEDAYLEALAAVPVLSPDVVGQRADFVRRFAEMLGEMGMDRLRLQRAADEGTERDALLRAVIDNAPFGAHMYELDGDERLVFIGHNRKAEEMLHIDHEPLLGLTLEEAFPGNVGREAPDMYRRVAREGGTRDLEQYAYDAKGITGIFELHAVGLGRNKVSVFFRDVTEKRAAELALHDANEMLAVAQRAARAGFWSWDVASGVLTWTPEFYELFGLPAGTEASFDTWRAALHPEDRAGAERRITEAMERHVVLENEYRIVLPDGTVRWIGATGTTEYDQAGRPLRMSGICIDIDERKRRDEEIRTLNEDLERRVTERTRELSLANLELQDFVYSVSHDLRSPLRALDGFSQVLLEDYADVVDEDGRGHLERIRTAAQHMAGLIDALLALSRVGRREVELRHVDLTAAARGIVDELIEAEPDREVRVSIAEELSARTDEALAEIVLRNLLGNAWKFTAHERAATIEVGAAREPDQLAFFVRDNGAGFDQQHAADMFRPFHRLHAHDEFPGTGIGLATVRRALDKLGGSCRAEGTPGEGATFYFTLG